MTRHIIFSLAIVACVLLGLAGCDWMDAPPTFSLKTVAESDRQWTGIAVTQEGRIFVNFPRWSDEVPFSVGELLPDGSVAPYPGDAWNRWHDSLSPADHFVCVQAVFVDDENSLWVLDPANPKFSGVVAGGPKLIQIDVTENEVVRVFPFDSTIAPAASYLNDVRIDTERDVAYISESGLGAIIVVNLVTGDARRLLAEHPSTKSEDIVLTIEGEEWIRPGGIKPQVHCDGIALSPQKDFIYFQALTGRNLYRIATSILLDSTLSDSALGLAVQLVDATGAADGIIFGGDGWLYLSSLEYNAIRRFNPTSETLETAVADRRISWPDSFARDGDSALYFTTAQIHKGGTVNEPYHVFRLSLPGDH